MNAITWIVSPERQYSRLGFQNHPCDLFVEGCTLSSSESGDFTDVHYILCHSHSRENLRIMNKVTGYRKHVLQKISFGFVQQYNTLVKYPMQIVPLPVT